MIEQLHIGRLKPESRFRNCDIRHIDFKPGLNLILGANTSGKTSLINCIQKYMCYGENRWSEAQQLYYMKHYHEILKHHYNVTIDGKVSKYVNYKPQELIEDANLDLDTQSTFDTRILSHFQSRGEGRKNYHDGFVKYVQNNYRFTENELLKVSEEDMELVDTESLVITADEPENSMAINMQFGLFDWFYEFANSYKNKLQIIVATHSVAAFKLAEKGLPNINVIELNKNWTKKILKYINE